MGAATSSGGAAGRPEANNVSGGRRLQAPQLSRIRWPGVDVNARQP